MKNDVRMLRSSQGSQNNTVKITEINPVEDFAFIRCTSFNFCFISVLMKLNNSLRINIESCVRMHKCKVRDSKMKATHILTHSICKSVRQIYLKFHLYKEPRSSLCTQVPCLAVKKKMESQHYN